MSAAWPALIEQIPKELPREFGIEIRFMDQDLRSQLKMFVGSMCSLGYTVYQWEDPADLITKFKFQK